MLDQNTEQSTIVLSATATRELQNDVLQILFHASESGANPDEVQEALRQRLSDALEVIRPLLKKEEVEVETSGFSISPRYNNKQQITGYQGTTALTVKGTDTVTISKLASEIKTMVVAGTSNVLSRKARKSVEKELTADAIAAFREKANEIVANFDYTSWKIGNVSVTVDRAYGHMRNRGAMIMAATAAPEATPLEHEGGKTEVNATVQGSIIVE